MMKQTTLDLLAERRVRAPTTISSGQIFVFCTTVLFVGYLGFAGSANAGVTVDLLLVPSLLVSALSIYGFFVSGGVVVNASSVTSLGVFLFGGFAGIYTSVGLNAIRATALVNETLLGLILMYLFQLLIVAPWVLRRRQPGIVPQSPVLITRLAPRIVLGTCMLGVAILDALLGERLLLAPVGLVGILLAIDGLFCAQKRSTIAVGLLTAIVLSWTYYEFVFHGFGRLVLGVLFCAMAVLFSLQPTRQPIADR